MSPFAPASVTPAPDGHVLDEAADTDDRPEVTTVSDDEVVVWTGGVPRRYTDLAPGTVHRLDGIEVRTLDRPDGELLATFATANDVHFGETLCGDIEALAALGPAIPQPADEPPYPETMNGAVIADIEARSAELLDGGSGGVEAVVVKGDLTTDGTVEQYEMFLAAYGSAFGDRLVHVRGNHDSYHGGTYASWPVQRRDVAGAALAVLDTSIPASSSGRCTPDQRDWLAEVATGADGSVLVFGHHHVWSPHANQRPDDYFGIHPDDSEALVEVFVAHDRLAGYFAGHTHRNRVRRFGSTGVVPWVEVACTKDFPGVWAEYRVYETGVLQVVRRVTDAAAVAWAERTRSLFGGLYPQYAFGSMADRCFRVR